MIQIIFSDVLSIENYMGDEDLNIDEYMIERVDAEIKWYSSKSTHCQKMYKRFQLTEIILASLIPVLSAYSAKWKFIAFIIAIFGAIIAIIQSTTKLYKYHENWIQYRTTCELLKYQKYLYLTQSYPYNKTDETIENIFVKNIENIISSENNQWKTIHTTDEESSKNLSQSSTSS